MLLGPYVPLDGRATGSAGPALPDPLDGLPAGAAPEPVTVVRLAEYAGRVAAGGGAGPLLLCAGGPAGRRTDSGAAGRLSAVTGWRWC
ncbi:hypothetical protein [Streptomyces subrutilus]|uniref:Uncharacterized protein n=1 Tax=Streptomyces subrutilus TaxID=36818 RepID=A0A1E5PPB4_9ACTN|nr:hypothetical protein [Streptomyces subrutilus]OEJ31395.1 hypothetical protein BGK67_08615 [Streptomyces subrutilus]